jgi:hypothetical protein
VDAASKFYTHYLEDPGNAYYTHAMVYSPGIVLIRDDSGDWRSLDVSTSAAVNAGEIRRELERQERLRRDRVEMEDWKKKGEERRKEVEKAMAERLRLREEAAKNKKVKEEIAKLKEQANLVKLQKKMVDKQETGKGKGKDYLPYALALKSAGSNRPCTLAFPESSSYTKFLILSSAPSALVSSKTALT